MSAKLIEFGKLQTSLDRQLKYTEIMCAGTEEREFKENMVKRGKGGQFATKAEKAAAAQAAAEANAAVLKAAPAGIVSLPDGTQAYKLSADEQQKLQAFKQKLEGELATLSKSSVNDPLKAALGLMEIMLEADQADKILGLPKAAVESFNAQEIAIAKAKQAQALSDATGPAKAKATAQVTKAAADNMSDDQVRKGSVEVSKKLKSPEPSKPEEVMAMLKNFATQAQANIDKGIKNAQSAGSETKAKALAAGMGLMTKMSEEWNSNPAAFVGGATESKLNEAGLSMKDPIGDAKQVGKDLAIDARQTAKRAEIGLKEGRKAASSAIGSGVETAKGLAGGGMKNAQNMADSARKSLNDAGAGAEPKIATVPSSLKSLGDAASSAKTALKDGSIGNAIKGIPNAIGQASEQAQALGQGGAKNLKAFGDAVRPYGNAIRDGVKSGTAALPGLLDGGGKNAQALGTALKPVGSALLDGGKGAAQIAGDTYLDATEALPGLARRASAGLGAASKGAQALGSTVSGGIDAAKQQYASMSQSATQQQKKQAETLAKARVNAEKLARAEQIKIQHQAHSALAQKLVKARTNPQPSQPETALQKAQRNARSTTILQKMAQEREYAGRKF